jgi:hypothetical protein
VLTLQAFLAKFPPGAVQPASPALLGAYRRILPEALLQLWEQVGLGQYAGGLLTLVDPREYAPALQGWLMQDQLSPDRVPIALSAFGTIMYYRRLGEDASDVAYIDPHHSETGVLSWSLEHFFNQSLTDPGVRDSLLHEPLFVDCLERHGPLSAGQMYTFVPALALGGKVDARHTEPADALVQLDFLLQLARG